MEIRFEYLYFGVFVAGIVALLIGWLLSLRKPRSWRQYEQFAMETLIKEGGTDAKLGRGRSDDGVDISITWKGQKYVVSCKRYKGERWGQRGEGDLVSLYAIQSKSYGNHD